ncbi:hypothetical protein JTB14_010047 [Gonioctena quinquepunctata]|nr:hypothetical protein JTB14_010047 [Gonioctena quinquepunctata]
MCLLGLAYGTTPVQGFFIEFTCSAILILVILGAVDIQKRLYKDSFSLRLGLTVAGLILSMGSFTGAGLNGARSFPPAVLNNNWKDHWIYEIAPLAGMVIGTGMYRFILNYHARFSLYRLLNIKKK